jgi:chromosome segregation ATPase
LTEQALYFAIGFLVASLAAIAILPALARRAARLSEARSRLQAPRTEKQAIAERDALRAQLAVENARIERRAVLAEERAIALRAEGGQQAVRLVALQADAAERENALIERQTEIETLRRDMQALEDSLAASQVALNDLTAQRDTAQSSADAASDRVGALEAEANRDRAKIAILAARSEHVEGRLDELSRTSKSAADAADRTQARLAADLGEESRKAAALEDRLRAALTLADSLSGQTADRQRTLEELERRLAASETAREQGLIEMSRQLAAVSDRDAEIKSAQAKARELEALIAAREREARAVGVSAGERSDSLATALASMEEALHAARAERELLRRENDELRAEPAGGDAALRAAIEKLGHEVARLWAEREGAEHYGREAGEQEAKDLLPFGRRSAGSTPLETAGADGARRAARVLER